MICTFVPSQGLRKQALRTHTTTGLKMQTEGPERCPIVKAFAMLVSFNLQLDTIYNHLKKKRVLLRTNLDQGGLCPCLWVVVIIANWGEKTHPVRGQHHFMGCGLDCPKVEKAS